MYEQEKIKPYGGNGDKEEQVARMFNSIAPTYDILNHRMSWNIDKSWRRKAVRQLTPFAPKNILDVATGTGDFAIMLAQILRPDSIIGVDISEGMMEVGRQKVEEAQLNGTVSFRKDDCMALTFGDNTFDAVTSAFGIRNFPDLDRGLGEMCRVLKPGGHLCLVELASPTAFPMKQLFKLYSHTVLPVYGKMISRDTSAYSYLTATIEAFPQGERMMDTLKKAGFSQASFKRLTGGICTCYIATK